MSIYGISLIPLMLALQNTNNTKQCWLADDASGAGSIKDVLKWWQSLEKVGPMFGYHPNALKCWLIVKPNKYEEAMEAFQNTGINVTTEGRRHLGAALGSRDFLEDYVNKKAEQWVEEVIKLSEFANSQPQACFAAYTFGLKHRWTYFMRTLPDIQDLLRPLEDALVSSFIPSLTGHRCNPTERQLLELPTRAGGLGIINPCTKAPVSYEASKRISAPLARKIIAQKWQLPDEDEVKKIKSDVERENHINIKQKSKNLFETVSPSSRRAMELSQEKGSTSWLNVIPLKEMGFYLNKREFRDALHLRYDWSILDKPAVCVCGDNFDTDHAMICKKGGFITMRYNELRDLEAELLNTVCKDVQIEPVLQDITGEILNPGANKSADARLDIHARGFWEKCTSAFFDVRVCHPNADTYIHHSPKQIYKMHEQEKKRQYATRVLEIEKGTFTPLVFTTAGGMGEECLRYHRRLAELLAMKKGEDYAKTMNWIRVKISFSLIRSALVCLRGS